LHYAMWIENVMARNSSVVIGKGVKIEKLGEW
jgi:hypothetical protein